MRGNIPVREMQMTDTSTPPEQVHPAEEPMPIAVAIEDDDAEFRRSLIQDGKLGRRRSGTPDS